MAYASEATVQSQDGFDIPLPGDRDPDPPASNPTIPPDTQMSPPPRGGDEDDEM